MTAAARRLVPLYSLAALLAGAALLELVVRAGWIMPTVVAPPSAIVPAFGRLQSDGNLVVPFFVTAGEVAAAALLAALAGLPFGYFLARNRDFGEAYAGWLGAAFSAPLVLLYPLFLVMFGRSIFTVIIMSAITAFIPIAINARDAFLDVPPVLRNVGASFNLDRRQAFRLIELPAAVPTLFVGLRLGIIYALVSTIGVEYLIDIGGLGRLVSDYYAFFYIPQMYAEIVLIVLMSLIYLWALDRVQEWLRPL